MAGDKQWIQAKFLVKFSNPKRRQKVARLQELGKVLGCRVSHWNVFTDMSPHCARQCACHVQESNLSRHALIDWHLVPWDPQNLPMCKLILEAQPLVLLRQSKSSKSCCLVECQQILGVWIQSFDPKVSGSKPGNLPKFSAVEYHTQYGCFKRSALF